MKDVPKIVIALDWFELRSQRRDIYKLSKHVKSLFLSSHRPSWHITHPQLQFKCPTKSIPIWRFKCPKKSFQIIKSNFPNLRVPQNISQFFTLDFEIERFKFYFFLPLFQLVTNWFHIFLLDLPSPHHTTFLLSPHFFRPAFTPAPIVWNNPNLKVWMSHKILFD